MIARRLSSLLLCTIFAQPLWAQLPTIELKSVTPPVVQVGTLSEFRVSGSNLVELDQLHFSIPGIAATQQMTDPPLLQQDPVGTGIFDLKTDNDLHPGLVDVRVQGRLGISNPRRLLVTRKPVKRSPSDNTTALQAAQIDTSTIYWDRSAAKIRKYYRLALSASQQLHAVVYTAQIDSRMTPTMVLYSDDGKELERSRGIRSWPAEISFAADRDAEFVLCVHDFLFRGGDDYGYLFECTVGKQSSRAPEPELNQLVKPLLSADTSDFRFSNLARLGNSRPLEGLPSERSDASDAEARVAPFYARGTFSDGPVTYDFTASKDQRLWIELLSSQLDQLTDPSVVLFQVIKNTESNTDTLKQLVERDDGGSLGGPEMRIRQRDPAFLWKAPADGTYRLLVRDHEAGDRPAESLTFELIVREPKPGFSLLAHRQFPNVNRATARPLGSQLMRGGTEAILVVANRHDGFSGPITLAIDGLPNGVVGGRGTIPAGSTETALILKADENAVGSISSLSVHGTAEIDGRVVQVKAFSGTVGHPTSSTHNAIVSRLCSDLHLSVGDRDTAPMLVQLGSEQTLEAAQGTTLKVPIKVVRQEAAKSAACLLRPQHLPPKTSLGDIKIAADKQEATANLKINKDAPLGEYQFWLQNETKVKWRSNPQALARAEAYLSKLNEAKAANEKSIDESKLDEAIKSQTKLVEDLKKQSAAKDITVWLPSTPVRVRITATK